MKKPIAAIAALVLGTTLLSGCFIAPPWWWGPGHEERWEGHHDRRRGALAPDQEQHRRTDLARQGKSERDADG